MAMMRPRFTGEELLRTRPTVYSNILTDLANGVSLNKITQSYNVSRNTVDAIRTHHRTPLEERKKTLAGLLMNISEVGAADAVTEIKRAPFNQKMIAVGIATDKLVQLTQSVAPVQIAVILPTEEQQRQREAIDARLDELTQRLKDRQSNDTVNTVSTD